MLGTKTDNKNIELMKLLYQLRQHIDIERIIGLNVGALNDSRISRHFMGYLQKTAQESLSMYFCKIYEESSRNELNSIPGIINSLTPEMITDEKKEKFYTFGIKYGNNIDPIETKSYLKETFDLFTDLHSQSLERLKTFRDKIGAHSDSNAIIQSLPSHAEFETLFNFAYDFDELICRTMIGNGPAVVSGNAGRGFIRLLTLLGVENPICEFDQ
jgi:hypothetical protein